MQVLFSLLSHPIELGSAAWVFTLDQLIRLYLGHSIVSPLSTLIELFRDLGGCERWIGGLDHKEQNFSRGDVRIRSS
jgi:hypothetical protein